MLESSRHLPAIPMGSSEAVHRVAGASAHDCPSILDAGPHRPGNGWMASRPFFHETVDWRGRHATTTALEGLLGRLELELEATGRPAVLALSYEAGCLLQASSLSEARAGELLQSLEKLELGRPIADLAIYESWIDSAAAIGNDVAAPSIAPFTVTPWRPALDQPAYAQAVEATRRAIADGDIYQLNLVNELRGRCDGDPASLYLAAREHTPAPYLAMLKRPEFALVSLSPERFLSREGEILKAAPIKGTARRSPDPAEDARIAAALVADPKNRAENVMIADLFRNDLGRLAVTGTVRATAIAELQSFPTVHHLVSEIECELRPGVSLLEILRATFPSGSITGAPKLRAMELIGELEPAPRGFSMGAIGVFRSRTSWEMSVAIRTLEVRGREATFPVGGAITWDSTPEGEWEECLVKRRALDQALEAARLAP